MMRKKKILIYTDCILFGGCEVVLTNISNYEHLKEKYDIIYSYRDFKSYRNELRIKVNNSIIRPLPLLSNETILYNALNKKEGLLISFRNKFLRFVDLLMIYTLYNSILLFFFFLKSKPDVLLINNGGYPGAKSCRLAAVVAKFAGIKNVLFNVNNIAFPPSSKIDRKYDKLVNESVLQFITASEAAGRRLSELRNIPIRKIINIPNSVKRRDIINNDLLFNEFNIDKSNYKIIGSVGLLTKRKGFDYLIKSVNYLKNIRGILDFKLFIFGEGEERDNLGSLIKRYGLENEVYLPGHRVNILDYIACFDIFVLPSIDNEDMPYVIIEAMMLGKPVIGTNVAGIPEEITDSETGYVIEPTNYLQLSEKIETLLGNNTLCKEYGMNGFNKFQKYFSYEVSMNKYLDLFDNITKK